MMLATRFLATVVLTLGIVASPLSAQATPNFSGTWALDLSQSNFGQLPAPQSRVEVIDHQEPKLVIKRTTVNAGTEVLTSLTYVVDGQPHPNTAGGAPVSSVLKWEGTTLVVTSTLTTPQGEMSITDRMTLSADGTSLTQARTLSFQGEAMVQTMVFTRRP